MNITLGAAPEAAASSAAVLHAAVWVRGGRLSIGRLLPSLGAAPPGPIAVCAGLRSACWLGPPGSTAPSLGRLVHHTTTRLDARGRVGLDRHVRGYLGVADPDAFAVVLVSLPGSGLLVVPVDDIDQRLARVDAP